MPKVHHVKKARKTNRKAGIKKGQEYWWAGYRRGRTSFKKYWRTAPRPSQVVSSEYESQVLSIQESMEDARPESGEDLEIMRDDWVSQIEELANECREKFENMPDSLQQGDTGVLLEERAEAMEQWSQSVGDVDCNRDEEDDINEALQEMISACNF